MHEDCVKITLNSFLFNAGVVGLLRMLEYARHYDEHGCEEGEDYYIEGQSLYIKLEFLLTRNLAELYVQSIVYYLGDSTKFKKLFNDNAMLDTFYNEANPKDELWKKHVDAIYKSFTDVLEKASFKSGYEILLTYNDITPPKASMVTKLKKESDYFIKKQLSDELYNLLDQPKVREVLTLKEIIYSKINMFMEGVGFLNRNNAKLDITEAYCNTFVTPLLNELENKREKNTSCIDCGSLSVNKTAISFLVDVADDIGRKKSYYWNCNPDAYLCPLCALVYSFAPIGFHYMGSDAVFINNNGDISVLRGMMEALRETAEETDTKSSRFKLYNLFTAEKIMQLHNRINNIQVIIRERDTNKYSFSMIDKQVINILVKCDSQLKYIQNRFVKNGSEFIDVYQNTLECIVNRRSLYCLMSKLIRISMHNAQQADYIFDLLQIEITSKGGTRMSENVKRAYVAKKYGESMRKLMTADIAERDRDNKLRGIVYQLLNSVSLGNRDNFMNLILRIYSSCGQPVPDIFFSCFESDETFKEIGYAYLLGLKSEENKKNVEVKSQ